MVRTKLSLPRAWVQSLIGKLRAHQRKRSLGTQQEGSHLPAKKRALTRGPNQPTLKGHFSKTSATGLKSALHTFSIKATAAPARRVRELDLHKQVVRAPSTDSARVHPLVGCSEPREQRQLCESWEGHTCFQKRQGWPIPLSTGGHLHWHRAGWRLE